MQGFFSESLLTKDDYFIAALLALFFTWMILNVTKLFKAVFKRPTQFDYRPNDLNKIIQKCNVLFPNETIQFQGETFKRGMNVRITTNNKKSFEGKLIGLNNENIICILTKTFIAADMLDNVAEIIHVEDITQ